MGPMVIGKNNAWAATFKTLGADDAATLIQMAHLSDQNYKGGSKWPETVILMIS